MQRHGTALTLAAGILVLLAASTATAQYKLTNLVSNQVGQASHTDPLLVNGWGLAYGPGSPFWVSDNGSGWSTLYSGTGAKQALNVEIPSASDNGPGSPTGVVFNGSQEFQVQAWASIFLFATLDGTISGWAPQSNLYNAIIAVRNPAAVYTGLAITSKPSGNHLFAADNANNRIEMYDGSFRLVKSFTDQTIAAGFSVFGIQDINGLVFATFASQSGGPGGYVDIFTEDGDFLKRVTEGSPLNQPWGLAAAPAHFGPLSNTLLVADNVNRRSVIHAYNVLTGQFAGAVKDTHGNRIEIDQLWAIMFGGGTPANGERNQLFFAAGPDNNLAGTFGVISLAP